MMDLTATRIWLATAPLDMRKSFDTLAEQVRVVLEQDPISGHLFVFASRGGHHLKILWYDGSGYCIYYKRLERGRFVLPPSSGKTLVIDRATLIQLLRGCTPMTPEKSEKIDTIAPLQTSPAVRSGGMQGGGCLSSVLSPRFSQ
jgi:transposase